MQQAPLQYTRTAIVLHWLIALAIFCSFGVGLYVDGMPLSPLKFKVITWHKWAGISILSLVLIRIVWRATHRPPALPTSMAPWERLAAEGAHYLLYVLMFAVPMIGWLFSSAAGRQVIWFNLIPLPDLVAKNEGLADILHETHAVLAWTLMTVVVLHLLAALKHHFISRDAVLARMLPFLNRS
ncbi:cytochrome b [Niveibacterium sp. SC-1]|uniref:cytochrome b n=1 Tax=Niveibacterium sp. SC-1 TaxID=3135646 RepID=UPI00311E8E25